MAVITTFLCILVSFSLVLWLWIKYRVHWNYRFIKMVAPIPGPKGYPVIGGIIDYLGDQEYIWTTLRKTWLQFGNTFKIWTANRCFIFISNPSDLEIILSSSKTIEKIFYRGLEAWLGRGLLISGGAKWKNRRKILTPTFHFTILKDFVDNFEKHSIAAVEKLEDECDKSYTNVVPIIAKFALHILCETTMGVSVEQKQEVIDLYEKDIHRFGELLVDRMVKPWFYLDFTYYLTPTGRQAMKTISNLRKFTKDIIDERLENWETTKSCQVWSSSGKPLPAMLNLLIEKMHEGADIDFDGIWEEVDTFMFEGHDTTATALSFCVFLLANHPEVQEKIYEEQLEIFGNDFNQKATYEQLQMMTYLECCIKESLRLYPSVPLISRELNQDLKIENYTLPAGAYVILMIYDLHHNPDIWPDPEKFDPDRFATENFCKHHPFAYIPFRSRNCIGQRFAMLEMKSFVSHLIRNYVLEFVDTQETVRLKADIVIRPSRGIRVKFRKRN